MSVTRDGSGFSVAVAGAGLAGLCLAQSLRQDGIDVHVYERDAGPLVRRQGYRITVDKTGTTALRRCLPPNLFELVSAVASGGSGYFRFTNRDLRDAFRLRFSADPTVAGQLDRQTLRTILLHGLGDRVHYGRAAVGATETAEGAELRFADGTVGAASVVVGADGAGSALRAALLPDLPPRDLGAAGVWGRTPLVVNGRSMIPSALENSGVLAVGDTPGRVAFFTSMRFQERPVDAFARLTPGTPPPVNDDYLMWAVAYPAADDPFPAGDVDPAELHAFAGRLAAEFHPAFRAMVAAAQPEFTVRTAMRAARRPTSWPMSRITLLGDAAHLMPPFAGAGGNTAMRDAALLGGKLRGALAPGGSVASALAEYRDEMLEYAFQQVDASLTQMRRMTSAGAFQRWLLSRALPRPHRRTVPVG